MIKVYDDSISLEKCYKEWVKIQMRLKTGATIDKEEQRMIEKRDWTMGTYSHSIAQYYVTPSENGNTGSRESSDKLYERNNGNFLKQVQLIRKFDLMM